MTESITFNGRTWVPMDALTDAEAERDHYEEISENDGEAIIRLTARLSAAEAENKRLTEERDAAYASRDTWQQVAGKAYNVLSGSLLHVHIAHRGIPREQFDCPKPQCAALVVELAELEGPPSSVNG